jgi:D-alanyl-D-alanine carboxypeptidase
LTRRRWRSPRRRSARRTGISFLVFLLPFLLLALALNFVLADGGSHPGAATVACTGADCLADVRPTSGANPLQPPSSNSRLGAPQTLAGQRVPEFTARSAAIIEGDCGATVFEFNDHMRMPPASIAKIMTALVAADQFNLDDMVDIKVDGAAFSFDTDATVMGLTPGMRLSVRDLLYGLLLSSAADAALALADHQPGGLPVFLQLMDARAASLGLRDSHFANPHGLDEPALYSSSFDMAQLGRELLRNPQLAQIVRTEVYQPAWDGPQLWSGNGLLGYYPGTVGIKVGYTPLASGTIVAASEQNGRLLIISLLGSALLYQDSMNLLDWAFANTVDACP